MMKKSLIIVFLIAAWYNSFSQSSISFGPEIGFANNFSNSSKPGLGASIEYVNKFSKGVGARMFAGYDNFRDKYVDGYVSFLSLRGGLQAFLAELLFIYGEGGIVSYHDSNNSNQAGFSFGIGAGYRMPLMTGQKFIQLSTHYNFFKYNNNSFYTWFNVRAAFGLNFGKTSTRK